MKRFPLGKETPLIGEMGEAQRGGPVPARELSPQVTEELYYLFDQRE